ncbi:hypothetical protein DNTS_024812 [Danionella cerebrum]|uniref:T-cell surface glycoprotein CD3 zeta chain n=1 Tax=Danionella cerebrum TaxID=2873325 RepID=A0A553QRX5_9TELE|nr:hypothetical protein DNTS_024812 [Danionella translucida]
MMSRALSLIVLLCCVPVSAQISVNDPSFCFILDGFLLIYAVIITGLFMRERLMKKRIMDVNPHDQSIDNSGRSEFNKPKRTHRSSEDPRGGHRMTDDPYMPLKKKTDDTYRELDTKGDRRRMDQVYQGLSSVPKDTYDSLQMQQFHPAAPPR